jgi:tRNA(fMet)-specific endonuclease VapC
MAKYLLDTNACIGIRNSFRGIASKDAARQAARDKLIAKWKAMPASDLAMSFFTLGELLVWVEKHANRTQARDLTDRLAQEVRVIGCPSCPEHGLPVQTLAAHYADIRAQLELTGQGIADNDLWIAAHGRVLGLTVVTHNTSHFGRVPALAIEDWEV